MSADKFPMNGQCFCGAVHYRLNTPPQATYYCHCRDCQYLAGSPFHLLAVVERNALQRQSGELSAHRHATQDGAEMTREFCSQCGSPLFLSSSRWDDISMLSVLSLDEPEVLKASFEIWTRSKSSLANIPEDIVSHLYGAQDGSTEPG